MKYQTLFAIALAIVAIGRGAYAGNGVGNGGDSLAVIFTQMGQHVVQLLERGLVLSNTQLLTSNEVVSLKNTVENTRVYSVDGPILDVFGKQVEARIVRDDGTTQHIEIDRSRWQALLGTDPKKGYPLAFHEYLRVLGKDDDKYQISGKLEVNSPSYWNLQDVWPASGSALSTATSMRVH